MARREKLGPFQTRTDVADVIYEITPSDAPVTIDTTDGSSYVAKQHEWELFPATPDASGPERFIFAVRCTRLGIELRPEEIAKIKW